MIVNFDSYINLKMNLAKGFAVIAIKVLIALLCLLAVSCGQPLDAINDRGGEIIENVTEKGVEVNKHVDNVTGTFSSNARKATSQALSTLKETRDIKDGIDNEHSQEYEKAQNIVKKACESQEPDFLNDSELQEYCDENF